MDARARKLTPRRTGRLGSQRSVNFNSIRLINHELTFRWSNPGKRTGPGRSVSGEVERMKVAPVVALALAVVAGAGGKNLEAAELAELQTPSVRVTSEDASSRFVALGIGKSVVVDLPRDIKDVLVANPAIANAVVRSARRAYFIGAAVGQTNVFFFDAEGRQIAGFDIAVKRDLNGMRAALRQLLPQADIRLEGVGDGVMLSGSVASAAEAQQAYDLAARLVGESAKVVNSLVVQGRDQVMLKVTVAEVQRNIIKQLGINVNGSIGYGASVVNFNTDNPFSAFGQPLTNSFLSGSFRSVNATLRAMERAGVLRTLAEPNLTAISGENANFLAGGEFPILAGYACSQATAASQQVCQPQILYKKFGVSLNFSPVVLAEGRISLKVMSEVSELTNDNGFPVVEPNGQTVIIPAIKTRRAETTLEIPSGGALAMAGMIQEQTKQQINGVPGLMQVPILGTLFKSRDYINNQTELMVIVTPYIVRSVAQKELSRPDDGFADAPDPATVLLGKLNRIYGAAGRPDPQAGYHGSYGFILD
jgi:pilus assembly protein CpaC